MKYNVLVTISILAIATACSNNTDVTVEYDNTATPPLVHVPVPVKPVGCITLHRGSQADMLKALNEVLGSGAMCCYLE